MQLRTLHLKNASRILRAGYAQGLGLFLVWLLIVTLAVPLSLPNRTPGSVRPAESRQLAEEESEPAGTPGQEEEEPDQFCVVRVNRIGPLDCLASGPLFHRARDVRPKATFRSAVDCLAPAELAGRNGSGCPLRC
jgi:hypothetical protein